MRVLVTGSSGMIGSTLCEWLLDRGHDVSGIDRVPNPWSERVDRLTQLADLRDGIEGGRRTRPADLVVHLAANARVHALVVQPAGALENVETTFHALEHARLTGTRFIFASSRELYGNQPATRYAEDDVDASVVESPYAASKLAGEALVRSYGRVYGMPWTIVRLSNVYGRNDLSERFIPQAFRCAMAGTPLTIYGAEKRLDFTYIDDALEGIVAIAERPDVAGDQVFNLASGQARSLVDVARAISRVLEVPLPLHFERSRPGEVISYEADLQRARQLLGYEPAVSIEEGLDRSRAWYAERFAADA